MKIFNCYGRIFPFAAALLCVLIAGGCALPVPEDKLADDAALQSFVSQPELLAVEAVKMGNYYFNQSRFVEAEMRFREALYLIDQLYTREKGKITQQHVPTTMSLAAALSRQSRFDEARELLEIVIDTFPEAFDPRFELAKLEADAKNYDYAARLFAAARDLALKLDLPDKAWLAARTLSSLYFNIGNEEDALCYSRAMLERKFDISSALRHVRLMVAVGRLNEAQAYINSMSIERSLARDSATLFERAMIAFGLNQDDEARELLEMARLQTMLDPQTRPESFLLVRLLSRSREIEEDDERIEQQQEQLEALLSNLGESLSAAYLFWPPRLITEAEDLAKELGIDNSAG